MVRVNGPMTLIAALALACATAAADPSDEIRLAFDRGDYASAMRLLKPQAEQGDRVAQTKLAQLFRRGLGVPLDYAAAAHWYRRAADQGDAAAQNALGVLYGVGLGVPRDYAEAAGWYRRAAEQGAPEHQFDLAMMYDNGLGVAQDFARAAEWYGKAAAQGLADAEANLGFLYQQGAGVRQDFAKAFELYSRAAAKGNAKAQNNLGLLYTRGEGVAQDYALAVDWYRKAAAQGFAKAITNLGVMVENGFGVKADEQEAIRLYRQGGGQDSASDAALDQARFMLDERITLRAEARARHYVAAAQGGDPDAQLALAYLLTSGPEAERDFRSAARLFQSVAGKGRPVAMANLGLLYVKGLGVPQDYVLGYMWINLAAANGLAPAATLRDALAARMTAAQVNGALARRRWSENSENRKD
jgi:uncharacterized protein